MAAHSLTLRKALGFTKGVLPALCLSAALMTPMAALAQTNNAQTNNRLTAAERNICKDLDMCADILLRHDPDGFDYAELARDFQRLGAPALQRLLQLLASGDDTSVTHAQFLLSQTSWRFPKAAQTQIARAWPRGDLKTHGDILVNIATPQMRDHAISTLVHPNADVRAQSREILEAMARAPRQTGQASLLTLPVPPAAFGDLVKAASDDPTPEIFTLIGNFPKAQSQPVLARFLLSEDWRVVGEAYQQFYRQGPDSALSAFKTSLRNIETPAQALALSKFLQSRNIARSRENKDGFYVRLAHSFLADKAMPPLAHMMAMDMILNSAPVQPLPNTPQVQTVFKNLVTQTNAPLTGFAQDFEKKAGANTPQFLPVIWAEILKRDAAPQDSSDTQAYAFMKLANNLADISDFKSSATPVLRQGLNFHKDWRVQKQAALGLGKIRDKASQSNLSQIVKSHPIVDVRAAAGAALSGIASGKMNFNAERVAASKASQYCSVQAFDFADDAKQLPFFDTGKLLDASGQTAVPAERQDLKTAFPTQSGWLAGYETRKSLGGLIYYDNQSGKASAISNKKTIAITPLKPTPLGTYASDFWVVDRADLLGANISYLSFKNGAAQLKQHSRLPDGIAAINVLKDQSLLFGFANKSHPPLRLLPNGRLVSGCAPLSAKPKSAVPQSLPK